MENFVVSARKYRPGTFSTVVGQEHVTDTLRNALLTKQLAHAFLFCGPRGVGKTTCARILAKAVNCFHLTPEGDPCNECDSCKAFNENRSLNIFELDAASNNSVEDIRSLIDSVRVAPQMGTKNVYIIDEVHMLSTAAFNAFLKTLEEPPAHALFILATTEKHKILPTILSRCQKFDFKRIKVDYITKHLKSIAEKENIKYELDALQLIAIKADGGLRDALSIFDQVVNFSKKNVTLKIVHENLSILDEDIYFEIMSYLHQKNYKNAILLFNQILDKGIDSVTFVSGLFSHVRNLIVTKNPETMKIMEVTDLHKKNYIQQSQIFSESYLLNAFQLVTEAEQKIRSSQAPNLLVELLLIKLANLWNAIQIILENEELQLKKKVV
jgi:DNA polymerase-3 subunit gamma/tau